MRHWWRWFLRFLLCWRKSRPAESMDRPAEFVELEQEPHPDIDGRLIKRPWKNGGSRWYLDGRPAVRTERRKYLAAKRRAAAKARRED